MIIIADRLKKKWPEIALAVMKFDVVIKGRDEELQASFMTYCDELARQFKNKNIKDIPAIKLARNCYKVLGRDPDRYNLSSEALLKRIKNGKGMYQINNLVDCGNFLSIKSFYPIGLYDLSKVKGQVTFDYGNLSEAYESLGKGLFDLENLPVLRDTISCFGSPSSDSKRTAISPCSKQVMLVMFSFNGDYDLSKWLMTASENLTNYSIANNFEKLIIK